MSMNEGVQAEHQWLARLIGDWEYLSSNTLGPDQEGEPMKGIENVRALGELWVVGTGTYDSGEGSWQSQITLGYDPAGGRFVGTFVASIMSHLWVYSGSLDAAADTLTLDAEGPDYSTGKTTRYQDVIQFQAPDQRTLSSRMLNAEGLWLPIMHASYRRLG